MGFFDDDDTFESIFDELLGRSPVKRKHKEQFIRNEDEDRIIDFLEDDERVYLIFELPGYDEKDISVVVKGKELEITAEKSNRENIQDYLHQKLKQGVSIRKRLPNFIDPKKISSTMRNGVLEIVFNKVKGGGDGQRKARIN